MKKKKYMLIVVVIVLAIIVLAGAAYFLLARKGSGPIAVPLDELRTEGEYRFKGLEWGTALTDVQEALPYKLTENQPKESSGEYIEYSTDVSFELGGSTAAAVFEFQGDSLNMVKFDFHLGEDYEEWFDAQVQELRGLYGEADDEMESSFDRFSGKGYMWLTEETVLQIMLITGGDGKPFAMLGVGKRP